MWLSLHFVYARRIPSAVLTPSYVSILRFGLFPVRSPLLRKSLLYFLFLRVLRCFSSPGSPPHTMYSCRGYRRINNGEFPHSDICGSTFICNYPQLFAACHVLLRRLVPRHPPYALRSLINFLRLSSYFRSNNLFSSAFYALYRNCLVYITHIPYLKLSYVLLVLYLLISCMSFIILNISSSSKSRYTLYYAVVNVQKKSNVAPKIEEK